MLSEMLSVLFYTLLGAAFFVINYIGPFSVMLSDDIELNTGKKVRHRWKYSKTTILQKFLFLDCIKAIIKWHYIVFICFIVSYILIAILLYIGVFVELPPALHTLLIFFVGICALSIAVAAFAHWPLYRDNVVRRRPRK